MLVIDVSAPLRTDDRYAFECRVRRHRPLRRRILRARSRTASGAGHVPSVVRFGFQTHGWRLEHHPAWDAIYPLMFLTRKGGPLFATRHRQARIRLAFPVPSAVRDFYVRRAHDLGLEVTIDAPLSSATFEGAAT